MPWEIDEGLYGVVYELGDGEHGADLIGTKSEAERIISGIAKRRLLAFQSGARRDG